MDQYLCQLCKKTIIFGEIHSCFFYKNYHDVHSLQQLDETHEHDAKNGKSKYGFSENSIDKSKKLCPIFPQSDVEEIKKIDFLSTKDKEQLSFRRDLNRKRTFSSLSDKTSVDAELSNPHDALQLGSISLCQENDVYCNENSSLKGLSENYVPGYDSKSGFCLHYKKKPSSSGDLHQQIKYEPKPSTSFQPPFSVEWEVSIQESKLRYFSNDKMKFEESVGAALKAPFHSKNIPQTKKTDEDRFEESRNLADASIYPKVSSQMLGRSEEICDNGSQSLDSFKAKSAVAGPSGIRIDLLRGEKRQFACDICHREFDFKSLFERHYRTHTGEKPFQCEICSKFFSQRTHLNKHFRRHTGEKPFVCDKCGRAFARKDVRDAHYRIHTSENLFVCDVCKRCFAQRSNLTDHVRSSTGKRPFK